MDRAVAHSIRYESWGSGESKEVTELCFWVKKHPEYDPRKELGDSVAFVALLFFFLFPSLLPSSFPPFLFQDRVSWILGRSGTCCVLSMT